MMQSNFVARCPYELGDLVILKSSGDIYEIYDIETMHSLRNMTVEFFYILRVNGIIQADKFKEEDIKMFMTKQMKNINDSIQ